jgi:hypothetical protein
MASFAFLYFIKRNERIRNKFAEITHIKGLSTNYYQVRELNKKTKIRMIRFFSKDLCRQRMQAQPTGKKSSETPTPPPPPPPPPSRSPVKHSSESSSSRSSTSSWTEESVSTMNMDIMTGHLILVCRLLLYISFYFYSF